MGDLEQEWIKPCDVMRLRRQRTLKNISSKKATQSSADQAARNKSESQNGENLERNLKRKNPFSCESQSKIPATDSTNSITRPPELANSRLFNCVDNLNSSNCQKPNLIDLYFENMRKASEKAIADAKNSSSEVLSLNNGVCIPEDWSLKSRMRFFVPTQYIERFWPLKGTDEALGISEFISKKPEENVDLKKLLQSYMMYYIYPNIPWLKLFPRMDHSKQKVTSQNGFLMNKDMEKALFNQWCDSMSSCYQNIKQNLTPYLYTCCQQMSILFLSSESSGKGETVVVVSPTSRGFRKSLEDEGIEYTLPLVTKKKKKDSSARDSENPSSSAGNITASKCTADDKCEGSPDTSSKTNTTDNNCCVVDENEDDDDDDDDESWFEGLGLDKTRYHTRDFEVPSASQNNDDDFKKIDYRPSSTILIRGMDCSAFFNFFINSSHLVSHVGQFAGIPPTILSPVAFKNASLQSLMLINRGELSGNLDNVITRKNSNDKRTLFEIAGPILPSNFKNICQLLSSNCGLYSAIFSILDSTVAFNCFKGEEDPSEEKSQSKISNELKCLTIRDLEFSDSLYTWNTCE